MAADANWELLILEMVQGFCLETLKGILEEDCPQPAGLDAASLHKTADPQQTLADMRRWLKLLDLAITPAMLREGITANLDQDLIEALLRYFVRKKSHTDFDRDKTDFLATCMYRYPRVKGQWEMHGYSLDGVAPMPPFEIALLEIFEDSELPVLGSDHLRLLNEFDYLREEIGHCEHFDALIESGSIAKGRQLKQSFGPALYHPHVLAVIAPYNAYVAGRFEELFRAAAERIKTFAEQLMRSGGSIQARVDGDITVQHLTELQEREILRTEYVRAQEQLRHLSKLQKAVHARQMAMKQRPGAAAPPMAPAPAPAPASKPAAPELARAKPESHEVVSLATAPVAAAKKLEEESRLRAVQESIRSFVKAADPKFRQVVPLRFGNFVLTPAEAGAYSADYLQETSFRGDNARLLVRLSAIIARMTGELHQMQQHEGLKYLWRPHAESLGFLLAVATQTTQDANRLLQLATERGLTEKVKALSDSLHRLQAQSETVKATLLRMGVEL